MKIIPTRFIPMVRIQPLQVINPLGHITERNDGPRCSREQVEHFKENWNSILPPKVIRSVKRHGDVMHGSRSVNMQVGPKYSRHARDFDVYSRKPHIRAKEIEDQIDNCVGCDIAYIERRNIPNVSGTEDDRLSDELYIIKTPHSSSGDVDYMKLPPGVPIVKVKGIYHETLQEAYRKAQKNRMHPLRAQKAYEDVQRIEEYWREKRRRFL